LGSQTTFRKQLSVESHLPHPD